MKNDSIASASSQKNEPFGLCGPVPTAIGLAERNQCPASRFCPPDALLEFIGVAG
jgi:hypothetical protein